MLEEKKIEPTKITITLEHNPYEITIFSPKKKSKKLIIFPLFNYQAERQYKDLINPLLEHDYRIMSVSLLEWGDRVLSLGYYYTILDKIIDTMYMRTFFTSDDQLMLMGFGVGANLACHLATTHFDNFSFTKLFLLSPVNRYRDEFKISNEIGKFQIPTYVYFGQFDSVNSINERFSIFQAAKNNPNVHFNCYPATGHYLYYKNSISLELEKLYKNSDFDLLIGETSNNKIPFLPSENILNNDFFTHLFNDLEGKRNKLRIALLTDSTPILVNGVTIVVDLLKKELDKLGYDTYVVSLWKKGLDYSLLPTTHHVPIIANYAVLLASHRKLWLLDTFKYSTNAKMLAMFGFNYLHLHTEYCMSKIALELGKYTGIKVLYTYHTLWKIYYENKFGHLIGDITYSRAKKIFFNRIYRECPVIIVPSKKSYEILKEDEKNEKDIRILPSPINSERFEITDEDKEKTLALKEQYKLDGKIVLGYVGRVSTEKNIVETIENISKCINQYPNIVFMIVGVGDAVDELHKFAKKFGIEDHMIYVGQVSNAELKLYYPLLDVFVTASNFETQGLTYFEAAATGTLILAKKDKAIEDIFIDNKNAYVYDGYEEWKERLDKIINQDNSQLIKNAKEMMKKYSQDVWAKKILNIYREMNDNK